MATNYTAEQPSPEGLEAVRRRPECTSATPIYTGCTIFVEVVDNSIDEAMAGYRDRIDVEIHQDGSLSVRDNGSGIPDGYSLKTGRSALETVLTVLHVGKFWQEGGHYKVSGGSTE